MGALHADARKTDEHPGMALRLADRIASVVVLDNDGGEADVLPSTGAVLGVQLHGYVRVGDRRLTPAGVTGLQDTLRTYAYAPSTRSVLVRFTPQGARCLGVPASELTNRSLALDDLLRPARAREVVERVAEARTSAEAVAVVEELLLALPFVPDPLVDQAVRMIGRGTDEEPQVAAIARALGVSERQLERRFRAAVGVSPKRFASLRRFEQAARRVADAPSLTHAAFESGYYDQSHFIREFRRFAGMSPGEWRQHVRPMSDSYK